jgi:putative chitinase
MTFDEWRAVLLKMEPRGKPWIIDGLADQMERLAIEFEINTVVRQQHFLAQVAHESDHFRTTQEYASGANYENRKDLGNTQKGDGRRFKGRGLIQLTGRANYTEAARALKEPYVEKPELVEVFPAAAIVSGWWWKAHGLNELADKDDVQLVTKRVNGGLNGLASRTALLATARTAIG